MKIPCETIVRFSALIDPTVDDPIFRTLRLDDGCIVACNRKFLAIEHVGTFDGVYHIDPMQGLLAQCEQEAQWSGSVEFIANDMLKFVTCKTTMGYVSQGNLGVFPDTMTDFDKWRAVARQCAEPAAVVKGAMIWHTDGLIRLAKCSPSGILVFEQTIDAETRPTVVRDINSPDWVGLFLPRIDDGRYHGPAALPGWLK